MSIKEYKNEESMNGKCNMLVKYGLEFIKMGPLGYEENKHILELAYAQFQNQDTNKCAQCMYATSYAERRLGRHRVRRLALLKKDLKKLGY